MQKVFIWERNVGDEEEGHAAIGQDGDDDGEMDVWGVVEGKE